MAELVLGSIVDSITGHLISLVSQEIGQAWGAKGELEKLQSTVTAIRALLREAERRQVEAEDVKDWLNQLKDVVYDADDLLDDYSTEALRCRTGMTGGCRRISKVVRIFFSSSNQLIYASKMAHRVKDVRERIDVITTNKVRFHLEGNTSYPGSLAENRVRPETYSSKPESYVIGRDKDMKEVIEFLRDRNFKENVSVLPIVGLGGLGKTTLARLVFNNEKVEELFMPKLWVCVSTNFSVENILRKIVQELTKNKDLGNLNMSQLHNVLIENIYGKRFLLVLDDVWNENRAKWVDLQEYLKNGAEGSKVLVTTRSLLVAKTMAKKFHKLRGLLEDESLSLLMEMAMKEEHEWKNKKLEMIAKEILKKCGGVPLAIKTIGRLLNTRDTEEDWLNFQHNDLSRINQEEGDIMPTLKLSYDFLPSHLKQCFAYCSLFPKDYELDPYELIHLWRAQGFIRPVGNQQTPEEAGQESFLELVWRSFFQDTEEDIWGRITKCKMHDLMHDLAQKVAGDNCITINNTSHAEKDLERARHVTMVEVEDYEFKGFEVNRRIRSLLIFGIKNTNRIEVSLLDFSCFRNLRALLLHYADVEVISGSIGKLKHLRSLDLSLNYELRSLPNSIGKLCNLETLNLRYCFNLETLPACITKLVNLRQLDVSECLKLTHMPKGIGKLTSLQMLLGFAVGEEGNSNAARLSELGGSMKRLSIGGLKRVESVSRDVDASFSIEKVALQSLEIYFCRRLNDGKVLEWLRPHPDLKELSITNYGGTRISSWVSQLHNLVHISFDGCRRCTHLPPLDQLASLKTFFLDGMADLEWIELSETATLSFFPSLEKLALRFRSGDRFRGWEWRRGNINSIEGHEDVHGGDDHSSSFSSIYMLPAFSDKVMIDSNYGLRCSHMHGRRLRLRSITNKVLQQLVKKDVVPSPASRPELPPNPPTKTAFISISSVPLSALTALTIQKMKDVEHLPMELFQSLPSLQNLKVSFSSRLKSLPGRAILRHLTELETLEISFCEELDLSAEHDQCDGEEQVHDLLLQGHSKLRRVHIENIGKTELLPKWLGCLSNLESLQVSYCYGLKSLDGGWILQLLTSTLESLEIERCPKLDLSWESQDQEEAPSYYLQLRNLKISHIKKMKTLPWWVQHLTNLETLCLSNSCNLKALPEWFPKLASLKRLVVVECGEELPRRCQRDTGEDWPKIAHIQEVYVMGG